MLSGSQGDAPAKGAPMDEDAPTDKRARIDLQVSLLEREWCCFKRVPDRKAELWDVQHTAQIRALQLHPDMSPQG